MATDTITSEFTWREPVVMIRSERYRPMLDRGLRDRALRAVDREGRAFARQPVTALHAVDLETQKAADEPLTPEQLAELTEESWIEMRLQVETREVPA